MSGRPSGRCAATEALEKVARAHHATITPSKLHHPKEVRFDRCQAKTCQLARAALASPCCVSATDQEQVKEALEEALKWANAGWEELDGRGQKAADRAHAQIAEALALLGSQNEEEEGR